MKVTSELMNAYAATTFTARTPPGEVRIRVGEKNPKLDALLAEHGVTAWAYVTAHNPSSVEQPPQENDRRHQSLQADVAARGLTCFEGDGVPDDTAWPPERSLLILGLGRTEAIELGARYGQLAIVAGVRGALPELVVTGPGPV